MPMAKYYKFLFYWLPLAVWAGGIAYFSGISGLASDMTVFWDVFYRKLFHAAEFGILNLLLWRALFFGEKQGFKKSLLWSLALTILYAISDEWHQTFVPLREGRWQDVAQDSLGALLTSGLVYYSFILISKRKNK